MTGVGVMLGLVLGFGATLVLSWWWARKPSLEARIEPYVRTSVRDAVARRTATVTPLPTVERLLAPAVRDGVRALERWGSPAIEVEKRLRRAGVALSVEQYRAQQVVWGIGGLLAGVALSLVLAATRGSAVVALVVLSAACVAGAVAGRDLMLSRSIRRRERQILAELPTIAELLALAVAAGESPLGALERVAGSTSGVLSTEMRGALAAARSGVRVPQALVQMSDAAAVPALRRFADGIVTAVERGTPLADVLRAQASDTRALGRRTLVEEGGRREIAMMVPVVFLILPVTVIFAVYPGLMAIDLGGR